MGTSKHTDIDFLTILLQDQIGGLQVLHQNRWVDVPPLHGSLVVNIGDIMQVSDVKRKSLSLYKNYEEEHSSYKACFSVGH